MPRRWTVEEEAEKRRELQEIYISQNKTIFQAGEELGVHWTTVYRRMQRLGIPSRPLEKPWSVQHRRICLPPRSSRFAELVGILLGDGHINQSTGQITIDSDSRTDAEYTKFLVKFLKQLTGRKPGVHKRKSERAVTVFLTSAAFLGHLKEHGLWHQNKVTAQAHMPQWVRRHKEWLKAFVRGAFDTDGSIYKLRFGVQWSFTNRSLPLLEDVRRSLRKLDYSPSRISGPKIYLTRRKDLVRYFAEIGTHNPKHLNRARAFGILQTARTGRYRSLVKRAWL